MPWSSPIDESLLAVKEELGSQPQVFFQAVSEQISDNNYSNGMTSYTQRAAQDLGLFDSDSSSKSTPSPANLQSPTHTNMLGITKTNLPTDTHLQQVR